jgi:hypothetical protein
VQKIKKATEIVLKLMQAQKVGQLMFTAPLQLGLKDSPKSTSEEGRRNNLWVMDKKTLKHRRIRIPNDRRIFYPNQIKLFKIY